MKNYKNISGQNLTLPGIGVVKADEVIEQPDGFNNANFETVGEVEINNAPEPEEETPEPETSEESSEDDEE